MFRDMRRFKQLLSREETEAILKAGTSGVLAVSGDDGYPYAVPLSYCYDGEAGEIYFHCASSGHKLDAVVRDSKASFCVIGEDTVIPERYTTHFRSAIVFGRVNILEGEEKLRAFRLLAARYTPDDEAGRLKEVEQNFDRACVLALKIEHMTGKEAIELVKAREKA